VPEAVGSNRDDRELDELDRELLTGVIVSWDRTYGNFTSSQEHLGTADALEQKQV
jgi:hypothetical protein